MLSIRCPNRGLNDVAVQCIVYHPNCCGLSCHLRLHDVIHTEKKLTLVFEYLDQDLKKFLDSEVEKPTPIIIKVSTLH